MSRQINRLSALSVRKATKPGRHSDGGGLYLVIDKHGSKRWVFIYRCRRTGRLREMGLGGQLSVSLAIARARALEARGVLAGGRDPIDARKTAGAGVPTFGELADQVVASLEAGWRNTKHRAQWRMTLGRYAGPLRSKPVHQIGTEDVLKVLQPIWTSKAETASRVRGRIEKVLDAAKAKGLREGENPARWRGNLDHLPRGCRPRDVECGCGRAPARCHSRSLPARAGFCSIISTAMPRSRLE